MARPAGQLDEISERIGRIDAYIHEGRHGINNMSQKLDAMAVDQAKRHEALKIELSNQMEKVALAIRAELAAAVVRIAILEETNHRQEGAIGVWKWLGSHWPFATVAAALAALITWANGKFHL